MDGFFFFFWPSSSDLFLSPYFFCFFFLFLRYCYTRASFFLSVCLFFLRCSCMRHFSLFLRGDWKLITPSQSPTWFGHSGYYFLLCCVVCCCGARGRKWSQHETGYFSPLQQLLVSHVKGAFFAVIDFGCCVASLEKCQIRDYVPPIFAVF